MANLNASVINNVNHRPYSRQVTDQLFCRVASTHTNWYTYAVGVWQNHTPFTLLLGESKACGVNCQMQLVEGEGHIKTHGHGLLTMFSRAGMGGFDPLVRWAHIPSNGGTLDSAKLSFWATFSATWRTIWWWTWKLEAICNLQFASKGVLLDWTQWWVYYNGFNECRSELSFLMLL